MTKPELLRRLRDLWDSGLLVVHPGATDRDVTKVLGVIGELEDWDLKDSEAAATRKLRAEMRKVELMRMRGGTG